MADGDDHPANLLIVEKARKRADKGNASMSKSQDFSPEQSTKKGLKRKHDLPDLDTNIAKGEAQDNSIHMNWQE